jgi:predicted RNA polymerase sigma factor
VSDARAVIDRVWRGDAGGMLGVLTRRLGDLDLAEEALQEAITEALVRWDASGVPENPPGWLVTTAWRKAIDRLRREATGRAKAAELAAEPPGPPSGDDRLAMIFACCHPALPEPAETVAAAFLLPRATAAQRLVRAKRHLREHGVQVTVPPPEEYATRLPAVLHVLYLLYNEGYLASSAESAERRDLAGEALDLARQLSALMPAEPEPAGLAALLELHESRAATRFDGDGRLVLLEDQDRSRWDADLVVSALRRLARAAARDAPGPYQLEAAIAVQHALAPSYGQTDWATVRKLYDLLVTWRPTAVALLGRAVATGFAVGPAEALAEVDALAGRLDGYRLWHATRADLLRRLGRQPEAAEATRRALALATNPAERDLLTRRLATLQPPPRRGDLRRPAHPKSPHPRDTDQAW